MASEARYSVNAIALSGAAGTKGVVPQNVKRVALALSVQVNGGTTDWSVQCDNGASFSFRVGGATLTVFLYRDWGPLVGKAWSVTITGPGTTLGALEVIDNQLPEVS